MARDIAGIIINYMEHDERNVCCTVKFSYSGLLNQESVIQHTFRSKRNALDFMLLKYNIVDASYPKDARDLSRDVIINIILDKLMEYDTSSTLIPTRAIRIIKMFIDNKEINLSSSVDSINMKDVKDYKEAITRVRELNFDRWEMVCEYSNNNLYQTYKISIETENWLIDRALDHAMGKS